MADETNGLSPFRDKIKSYWNRPGGKWGTIIFYGLLGLAGYKFFTAILPKLLQLFDDTTEFAFGLTKAVVSMGACAFVVCGILYAVMNPRFRAGIVHLWEKVFINSWLSLLIKTDPKAIAQGKIDDFREERERFREKSAEIDGVYVATTRELRSIESKRKDIAKKVAVLTISNGKEAGVLALEDGYLEKWYNKLTPLSQGLEKAKKACDEIYENSGYALRNMENQFKYTVIEFESTRKAAGALRSAFSMFSGNSAKARLGDEALLEMENQISTNLGSMRNDMKNIEGWMNSIDLEKQVYAADGLKMIENLNPGLYKSITNGPETVKVSVGPTTTGNDKFQELTKL